MNSTNELAKAEHASKARAFLMAAAGMIMAINGLPGFEPPAEAPFGWRSVAWIVLVAFWLLILATGGWLRLDRQTRMLMNDERSLQNRAAAHRSGFWTAMIAGMALYLVSLWMPIAPREALRMLTAAALAVALLHYAWLEWR
jgi:predicted permease